MARRRKAELIEARALSPSVRSLLFRTADGSTVGHLAGQYLDLLVPTARGLPFRRSYSIASPPDPAQPDRFEIAVTRVEGGPTSEALHTLAPGQRVEMEGPRGTFVRASEHRAHPGLFIATGTGLAPLRAMLAQEIGAETESADLGPPASVAPARPLVLLFGCRSPADLLWADELRAWQRSCTRFRLHVTLSRAPPEWTGLVGYVQRHAHAIARSLPGAHAYVCGLSAMVGDVVALLERDGGLPHEAVHYEVYD
jgi:ferredoxin-NADP reductase